MFKRSEMPKILIQKTLFDCILNDHGLGCFPVLNMKSINGKRYQESRTPEQKINFKKKMSCVMSKIMHRVRTDFCANRTKAQKKEFSRRTIKRNKEYWNTLTEEEATALKKKMSDRAGPAMVKRWALEPIDLGSGDDVRRRLHRIGKVEDNLPRINTYSGVITESEMESL